jgi:hypothetical protein
MTSRHRLPGLIHSGRSGQRRFAPRAARRAIERFAKPSLAPPALAFDCLLARSPRTSRGEFHRAADLAQGTERSTPKIGTAKTRRSILQVYKHRYQRLNFTIGRSTSPPNCTRTLQRTEALPLMSDELVGRTGQSGHLYQSVPGVEHQPRSLCFAHRILSDRVALYFCARDKCCRDGVGWDTLYNEEQCQSTSRSSKPQLHIPLPASRNRTKSRTA